jgi:hypothetical protein
MASTQEPAVALRLMTMEHNLGHQSVGQYVRPRPASAL